MTTAVVVRSAAPDQACATLVRAGVGEPGELSPDLVTSLRTLAEQLRSGERLVVVDASAVVATAALGRLVDDASVGTAVLVSPALREQRPLRVEHHHVVSASSDHHAVAGGTTGSLGALVVHPSDAAAAAAALEEMAGCADQHGWTGDVVDHAVVALVRREVAVRAVAAAGPSVRTDDASVRDAVAAELAGGADERARRDSGNRVDDGFYSTFVLRRLSKPMTELALRLGLSPNQVSLLSFAIGLLSAGLFAVGALPATVAAALLLQLSIVVDCVDGEVARRTRRFSALGAWLDASTDRVKEFAVYAGLAVASDGDLWLLAGVVLVMQTARHMTDYDFARVQRTRETWVAPRPLDDPSDGGAVSYGAALDASRKASAHQWVAWVKKAVHMPIGERWLVISVGSVLAGPTAVLAALLALGLLAIGYTAAGRLLRVRSWAPGHPRMSGEVLRPQLDLALLPAPAMTGRLAWAGPGLLRLLELGTVLLVTQVVDADLLPWAYALCFVLAYHHYDTLYRALGGSEPPRWLVRGGLGLELRLALVVLAGVLGDDVLRVVLVVGTVGLAAWSVVVASAQFVHSLRSA